MPATDCRNDYGPLKLTARVLIKGRKRTIVSRTAGDGEINIGDLAALVEAEAPVGFVGRLSRRLRGADETPDSLVADMILDADTIMVDAQLPSGAIVEFPLSLSHAETGKARDDFDEVHAWIRERYGAGSAIEREILEQTVSRQPVRPTESAKHVAKVTGALLDTLQGQPEALLDAGYLAARPALWTNQRGRIIDMIMASPASRAMLPAIVEDLDARFAARARNAGAPLTDETRVDGILAEVLLRARIHPDESRRWDGGEDPGRTDRLIFQASSAAIRQVHTDLNWRTTESMAYCGLTAGHILELEGRHVTLPEVKRLTAFLERTSADADSPAERVSRTDDWLRYRVESDYTTSLYALALRDEDPELGAEKFRAAVSSAGLDLDKVQEAAKLVPGRTGAQPPGGAWTVRGSEYSYDDKDLKDQVVSLAASHLIDVVTAKPGTRTGKPTVFQGKDGCVVVAPLYASTRYHRSGEYPEQVVVHFHKDGQIETFFGTGVPTVDQDKVYWGYKFDPRTRDSVESLEYTKAMA